MAIWQAIEAIEALQTAIGEVAKSKESWKRFFSAGKYMERMTEAKTRVETAVDIIQKHLIIDTKSEVLKITAMLKAVVWGPLTDMSRGVAEVSSSLKAGFAEMKEELTQVNAKLDKQAAAQAQVSQNLNQKLDHILNMVSHQSDSVSVAKHGAAMIPPEVPELPATLQARPELIAAMKERVLGKASGTTAVCALSRGAAATMSAHGMGGVGKTTLAACLIRDPVRTQDARTRARARARAHTHTERSNSL